MTNELPSVTRPRYVAYISGRLDGTIVEQGNLILGNVSALGANTASLAIVGGTLDLNGLSPTIGALSGANGTSIKNSTSTPAVLTLDASLAPSTYNCYITDGTGGVP